MLAVDRVDPPVAQDTDRIVAVAGTKLRVSDKNRGSAPGRSRQRLELALAGLEKRGPEEQVFRWIAAQRKFRGNDQIGAAAPCSVSGVGDACRVSLEIANHLIELSDSDAHG